jgi:hypothetical protein
LSALFNFAKIMTDPDLQNPYDTNVLRKLFGHPKPRQCNAMHVRISLTPAPVILCLQASFTDGFSTVLPTFANFWTWIEMNLAVRNQIPITWWPNLDTAICHDSSGIIENYFIFFGKPFIDKCGNR